jgi:hypothetical protein
VDAIIVPWLWADVNMAVERQLFPLGSAKSEVRLTLKQAALKRLHFRRSACRTIAQKKPVAP